MNIVKGTLENGSFTVPDGAVPLGSVAARGDIYLGFRPEDAILVPVADAMLRARIYSAEMTGNETIVTCDMNGEQVVVRADKDYEGALDAAVGIDLDPVKARLFNRDSGRRIRR
jgi:multiple sugar transport system ATP-binding protein